MPPEYQPRPLCLFVLEQLPSTFGVFSSQNLTVNQKDQPPVVAVAAADADAAAAAVVVLGFLPAVQTERERMV